MDSQRPSFDIRIIELPVDQPADREETYHDFLLKNPETITKGLIPIAKEFSIPNTSLIPNGRPGRVDIVFMKENILYLVEVKRASIHDYETQREKAIPQISRYLNGMKYLFPLLKENIQIKGIIILFISGLEQRKEYNVNGTPLEPLSKENNYIPELNALIKHLETLKKDIKTLTRKKEKLTLTIKKLDGKREEIYHEIDNKRNENFNILMDTVIAKGQLVQASASGSKILKIDNILKEAKELYFVESSTGFYQEDKLNKGKRAYFYFSPRINAAAFAKIQKLAKLRHYANGL